MYRYPNRQPNGCPYPCLPDALADRRNRGRTSYGHLSSTLALIGFIAIFLTACATEKIEPRQGVREAKACLKRINRSIPTYDNFLIRHCTHNGVWLVEERDIATDDFRALYDFVNKEYKGPETGDMPIDIDTLGGGQERDFFTLQKNLNKALLIE